MDKVITYTNDKIKLNKYMKTEKEIKEFINKNYKENTLYKYVNNVDNNNNNNNKSLLNIKDINREDSFKKTLDFIYNIFTNNTTDNIDNTNNLLKAKIQACYLYTNQEDDYNQDCKYDDTLNINDINSSNDILSISNENNHLLFIINLLTFFVDNTNNNNNNNISNTDINTNKIINPSYLKLAKFQQLILESTTDEYLELETLHSFSEDLMSQHEAFLTVFLLSPLLFEDEKQEEDFYLNSLNGEKIKFLKLKIEQEFTIDFYDSYHNGLFIELVKLSNAKINKVVNKERNVGVETLIDMVNDLQIDSGDEKMINEMICNMSSSYNIDLISNILKVCLLSFLNK